MAGYNPQEAVDFWGRMSDGGSGSTPEFLSTHPADKNRIESLNSIMSEVKGKYYQK